MRFGDIQRTCTQASKAVYRLIFLSVTLRCCAPHNLRQCSIGGVLGDCMSEKNKEHDSGVAPSTIGVDPAAMALALGGASREDAGAFLKKQSALIDDQQHHLHEQFKHLRLSVREKQLTVSLLFLTALVGISIATAFSCMVWQASQSNALLIEPFSVPPDMVSKGVTGQVVAAKVLDRLNEMQSQTNTARSAKSYANSWEAHGIKLEIPETGISLSELDGWLRQKLGNDTRVTGDVVRTATGITITARTADDGAVTVSGSDGEVDALATRLADSIYLLTQPYRYAAFLQRHENRAADALPIFKRLALSGSPDDRLWSYNMWAGAVPFKSSQAQLAMYQIAVAAEPNSVGTYDNLAGSYTSLGRSEEALKTLKTEYSVLHNGRQRYVTAARMPIVERRLKASLDEMSGAYHDALGVRLDNLKTGSLGIPTPQLQNRLIATHIRLHNPSAARAVFENVPPNINSLVSTQLASADEDWVQVLKQVEKDKAYFEKFPANRLGWITRTAPLIGPAQARLGMFAEAERTIAPTTSNCYPCLIARAQIAAMQTQPARADFWFSRATAEGPSLPFAHHDWGQSYLSRGKPDDAIAQFTIANKKGPHFADPLEGWGEALMAKNQSHLALAKFTEAEKYAPKWGRLHMKWGEALGYAGQPEKAKAQYALAAGLDLTPGEKVELAYLTRRGS